MKTVVDIETGTKLVADPNGELVEIRDIFGGSRMERMSEVWGYAIWSEDYSKKLHGDCGFESEDEAYDAAAYWLDDVYGHGKWSC